MRIRTIQAGMLLFIGYILCTGCTKKADGLPGPTGPAGNAGSGANDSRSAITGFVRLTNQYSIPEQAYDGVQVSTKMGDSAIKVTTDQSGKFTLPALKSGTYRILFQKNGYDSIAENVVHSAGSQDKFIGIVEMDGSLTTHILDQTMQLLHSQFTPGVKYLELTTNVDGPPLTDYTRRYFAIYFSTTADVSDQHFIYQYNGSSNNEGTNQLIIQIYFNGQMIGNTQMHAGDSVYVKTYFTPDPGMQTTWFDSNTYENIPYPYTGDSVVKSFLWTN